MNGTINALLFAGLSMLAGFILGYIARGIGRWRVLLKSDAYCPNCGHNRDASAASSLDAGIFKECQMCGARWRED